MDITRALRRDFIRGSRDEKGTQKLLDLFGGLEDLVMTGSLINL